MLSVEAICIRAKQASCSLALLSAVKKNAALAALADWLDAHQDEILRENKLDIKDGINSGLSDAMVDRLTLTLDRIKGIARDVRSVINLPDPVGEEFEEKILENGLQAKKQRIPLGVLAVIYESRPNVTVDVAALAIKTGNAIILRGGKETIRSNRVLVRGIHEALESTGIDSGCVQFISEPDRKHVEELLKMYQYVDMLIPRGGAGLRGRAMGGPQRTNGRVTSGRSRRQDRGAVACLGQVSVVAAAGAAGYHLPETQKLLERGRQVGSRLSTCPTGHPSPVPYWCPQIFR